MRNKLLVALLFVSLGVNVAFFWTIRSGASTSAPIKIVKQPSISDSSIFSEINPKEGFEINATYGNLGPTMISSGVIDYEKFKVAYAKSGQSLPLELDEILSKGSKQKIRITSENSYFLLNFFWAVGLNNKSNILTAGDMVKYGGEKELGNFASTGGWSLARGNAMNYYSATKLIPLTREQESLVKKVSENIYRPCCNNPTSFPDCNHGMALLGVLELLSASGASEDQMFNAAKYFNAFWFPGNYYELGMYFKNKEGIAFKNLDAKILLSKDYSSATGIQNVKRWLIDNGYVNESPKNGGGCGV